MFHQSVCDGPTNFQPPLTGFWTIRGGRGRDCLCRRSVQRFNPSFRTPSPKFYPALRIRYPLPSNVSSIRQRQENVNFSHFVMDSESSSHQAASCAEGSEFFSRSLRALLSSTRFTLPPSNVCNLPMPFECSLEITIVGPAPSPSFPGCFQISGSRLVYGYYLLLLVQRLSTSFV